MAIIGEGGSRKLRAGRAGWNQGRRRARPVAEVLEGRQLLATITVNTTGDGVDGSDTLSLRQAIELANGDLAPSALTPAQARQVVGALDFTVPTTIDFAIPGTGPFTIAPSSQYPPIDNPVVIDGYSQPGSHPNTNGPGLPDNAIILIELDGASDFEGSYGLTLQGGNSIVQGLAIGGFQVNPGYGIGGVGLLLETPGGDLIRGDFFGLDATGTLSRPNAVGDIGDFGGSQTIGGTAAADRNVIAGSLGDIPGREGYGLDIFNSADLIQGNFIGTDVTGARAVPNGIGIEVSSLASPTIGGTVTGAGNVISGNAGDGVNITNSADLVQGNLIGTDLTGTRPLGNGGDGVDLAPSGGSELSSSNTIGGTAAGAGNVIANNQGDGVVVSQSFTAVFSNPGTFTGLEGFTLLAGSGQSNTISRNSIFGNEGLGIHLLTTLESLDKLEPSGPPYLPTPGDLPGANALLAAPTLESATPQGAGSAISGTVAGAPSTSFTVELFADPTGSGQGKTYLGSTLATTDASGIASFTFASSDNIGGQYATATATDPKGDTSEFARPLLVAPSTTTTTLAGPSGLLLLGQPLTLTASVHFSGGEPTGFVAFAEAGGLLGLEPVNASGLATFTISGLAIGNYVIQAAYLGDPANAPSLSNALAVAIAPPPTIVSLLGPNRVATQGQPITFAAAASNTAGVPTGQVAFLEDGVVLGTVTLDTNGMASFVTDQLLPGPHVITADYLGNATDPAGQSNAVAVEVNNVTAFGGPAVTSDVLSRTNAVTVTFNRGLFIGPAQDVANYKIVGPRRQSIAIESAVYDPSNASVTLTTAQALDPHKTYVLTINGEKGDRLVNVFGIALNGKTKGKPGHDYSGKVEVKKTAVVKVTHSSTPKPKVHATAHKKGR